MKEIIGLILIVVGFIVFWMARRPIEKRPILFDLGLLTSLIYISLIIIGLYLLFK